MEQSVHGIVLDLRDIHNPRHLDVKQGDTGVRLCVVLTDGGKPYRLTPDCYGVFTAKKPDGTCIFNRCTTENGRLVYDFTPQTTAAPGDLDCQLKLYGKNDRLLTTAAFTVTVHETVYNEGDTLASETEVTALTRLISQTTDLVDTVQTKLDTGEFHGKTPHIGENGNWFLGETDTGIAAGTLDDSRVSEATTWSSRKLQDAMKDFVKLETAPVVRYDKSQYLPVEQARTARGNIGAAIQGPEGDVVSRGVHIYEDTYVENDEVYYTDTFLRGAIEGDNSPVLRVFSTGRTKYIAPDEHWDYHEAGKDTILRGIAPGRNANDAVTKKQLEEAIAAGGGGVSGDIVANSLETPSLRVWAKDSGGDYGAEIVPGPLEEVKNDDPIVVLMLRSVWAAGVRMRGLEPGKEDTDAVNVKQFNDALGNVESALDGIIALQNALIGGGSV